MKTLIVAVVLVASTYSVAMAKSVEGEQTQQGSVDRCKEDAVRDAFATPQESLDFVINCPNVLRLANVIAEAEQDDVSINQSGRDTGKGDLPMIPDSNTSTGSKIQGQ